MREHSEFFTRDRHSQLLSLCKGLWGSVVIWNENTALDFTSNCASWIPCVLNNDSRAKWRTPMRYRKQNIMQLRKHKKCHVRWDKPEKYPFLFKTSLFPWVWSRPIACPSECTGISWFGSSITVELLYSSLSRRNMKPRSWRYQFCLGNVVQEGDLQRATCKQRCGTQHSPMPWIYELIQTLTGLSCESHYGQWKCNNWKIGQQLHWLKRQEEKRSKKRGSTWR